MATPDTIVLRRHRTWMNGQTSASIPLHARGAHPGVYSNVQVFAKGVEAPAWRSVKISGGEGEGQTFARIDRAALVVSERPLFALEAEVTRVTLVRGHYRSRGPSRP